MKILTVTDEFHRKSLAIQVEGRLLSQKVIEVLKSLFEQHGAPEFIPSDNGPKVVAKAVAEQFGNTSTLKSGTILSPRAANRKTTRR